MKAQLRRAGLAAKGAAKTEDVSVQDAVDEVKEEDEKDEKKEGKEGKERKIKKEKKSKREEKEPTTEAQEEKADKPESAADPDPADAGTPSRKRKRDLAVSEIEINVDLPEPPSKKALRKLKKNPSLAATTTVAAAADSDKPEPKPGKSTPDKPQEFSEHASQSRSKWGIWIGNLAFSTTELQLGELFTNAPSKIKPTEVTRIHLPTEQRTKRNRGFAYVDFANQTALDHALTLTETLLGGRRVLIKDAKDFSNRSAGNPGDGPKLGPNMTSKPPSKILFVGNLDFETKDEDLRKHFEFAGRIARVRLATFEDTNKCKGFGFVDFEDIDSTKRALLGLTEQEELMRNSLEGKDEKELAERQKKRRFIGSRQIKMEFGEDSSVRYKKRFGKDRPDAEKEQTEREREPRGKREMRRPPKQEEDWAEQAWERKREKMAMMDKRSKDPGAAYSNDVRRTGAITESKGKRIKFDDA